MKTFEEWLRERLALFGCIGGEIEDDDLHAAIERFQLVRGIDVTGVTCPETIAQLRRNASRNPESELVTYLQVPPVNGSIYAGASA